MTSAWPRAWGMHFIPSAGVGALLEASAYAQQAGVSEVSLSDEAFSVEPLTALAAIASRHSGLRVGVRVTNPYLRHPLTLAREARVIAELSTTGLVLGLGVGGAMSLNSTGMMARRRIDGLTATLTALRGLLSGDHVSMQTSDFLLDGHLDGPALPPEHIRFEMTGRGPKMLAAAAVQADAVLIVGLSFDEGARTVAYVREAARRAGRPEPCVTWATYIVDDESMLDDIAPYVAYGVAEATMADRAVDAETVAEIREVLNRDGRIAAGKRVPRPYLEARAVMGPPTECRLRLERWAEEQRIDRILLRIPESAARDRWLEVAAHTAAPPPAHGTFIQEV